MVGGRYPVKKVDLRIFGNPDNFSVMKLFSTKKIPSIMDYVKSFRDLHVYKLAKRLAKEFLRFQKPSPLKKGTH